MNTQTAILEGAFYGNVYDGLSSKQPPLKRISSVGSYRPKESFFGNKKITPALKVEIGNVLDVKSSNVIIVRSLREDEFLLGAQSILSVLFSKEVAAFKSKILFVNGERMAEIIDMDTGDPSYIHPPKVDTKGNKIEVSGCYNVSLRKHHFFKKYFYVFQKSSPKATLTREEVRNILEKMDTEI